MILRPYNATTDKDAIHRVWYEVGWSEKDDKHKEDTMDIFVEASRVAVGELEGAVESAVLTLPAELRYLDEDIPMSAVTSVSTSRVARKRGLASHLTAFSLARDAAEGALVAGLGMFDQGYYDQLGFGTARYGHWIRFEPSRLKVAYRPRLPIRLTSDDWEEAHQARLDRWRCHGSVSLISPRFTLAEMRWTKGPFGLGYRDGPDNRISHYVWCSAPSVEHGPYRVQFLAYRTRDQFLELMALLRDLGDQVPLITIPEPPHIQLQDLLDRPFRARRLTEGSQYALGIFALAPWQVRICDLRGCLEHTHLPGESVCFNLELADPIERFLRPDAPWRGIGGQYIVTLGPSSCAEPGSDPSLPTLKATVNAFTRLWLGVRPATGLSFTDRLQASAGLLEQLDLVLRLPEPMMDWDF